MDGGRVRKVAKIEDFVSLIVHADHFRLRTLQNTHKAQVFNINYNYYREYMTIISPLIV